MGWEIGLLFVGVIVSVLFGWYLYRRSTNGTAEDTDQAADADENVDEYEDCS